MHLPGDPFRPRRAGIGPRRQASPVNALRLRPRLVVRQPRSCASATAAACPAWQQRLYPTTASPSSVVANSPTPAPAPSTATGGRPAHREADSRAARSASPILLAARSAGRCSSRALGRRSRKKSSRKISSSIARSNRGAPTRARSLRWLSGPSATSIRRTSSRGAFDLIGGAARVRVTFTLTPSVIRACRSCGWRLCQGLIRRQRILCLFSPSPVAPSHPPRPFSSCPHSASSPSAALLAASAASAPRRWEHPLHLCRRLGPLRQHLTPASTACPRLTT